MKYIYTLFATLAISFCFGQAQLASFTFDSDEEGFFADGDATGAFGSFGYDANLGNPGGAIYFGGSSTDGAGRAFMVKYATGANFDFGSSTYVEVKYDLKVKSPLASAALHLSLQASNATTQHNDLQNKGINDSTWTTITSDISGITTSTGVFMLLFNIAGGAVANSGGEILIDNVVVTGYDSNPNEKTVTVRVDTSGLSPTDVSVMGDFNGWDSASNPMTDADSDGIYETDLTLTSDKMQFKFVVDGAEETFTQGHVGTVTMGGFTNRYLVLDGDLTTVAYPFDAAYATGNKNVTFKVDYSAESGFEVAHINSNFNGWCGDCNPMTDTDADGIWEATLPLPAGAYELKFTKDGWVGQENFDGVDHPGIVNNNRYLNVDSDMTVTAVYNTESTLSFDLVKSIDNIKVSLYPNPVNNIAYISADESIDNLRIYDITGRVIMQHTPNKTDFSLNVSNLSKGVYLVKLNSGNKEATTKLIK